MSANVQRGLTVCAGFKIEVVAVLTWTHKPVCSEQNMDESAPLLMPQLLEGYSTGIWPITGVSMKQGALPITPANDVHTDHAQPQQDTHCGNESLRSHPQTFRVSVVSATHSWQLLLHPRCIKGHAVSSTPTTTQAWQAIGPSAIRSCLCHCCRPASAAHGPHST